MDLSWVLQLNEAGFMVPISSFQCKEEDFVPKRTFQLDNTRYIRPCLEMVKLTIENSLENMFYGFELVSSAKGGWFYGFKMKFLMQRSGFWPKMTISGGHYQVDRIIFRNGQIWGKTPENGNFPHFSAPGPPDNFFQLPKLFARGFLAIPAKILKKQQKIEISSFWAHFQENGSRWAKNDPRNPWDMPNGYFQAIFSSHNIKICFLKSVPEISQYVQTSCLKQSTLP